MVNTIVSVGADGTIPAFIKVVDTSLPQRLQDTDLTTKIDGRVSPLVTSAVPPAVSSYIAGDASVVSSAATMAQNTAGLVPVWKASTSYTAGQRVIAPNGDIVSAKVNFTSSASYSAANWNPSTQDGRIGTLEAGKWARGDIATPVDFNTLTTPGSYGILSSSGTNQPTAYVGSLDAKTFGTGTVQQYTTWETVPRPLLRNNSAGTWRQWLEYRLEDPALFDWRTAYRDCTTAPAQILAVGDSITEGTGTTTLANRWQTVLQSYLRRQVGNQGGATFPFIPAKYATTATGQPVTQAGTVTTGFGWGLGWRAARLEDATSILTFTFTGTSATLMYTKTTTTGVMNISVDGGTPVVVNTNGTTNNAATWSTGALTQGVHTVVVKRDASSAAGQYVYAQGLLTYDGDETKGVRVVDAAKHGITSAQLTQGNSDNTATALKAAGPFAAVIIGLGTNDYSAGTSVLTYRDNILRLIASTRATIGGFTGSIILVNMYMGSGRDDATWAPYGAQLAVIAAADPKVKYLDLRWDLPDIPSPTTDPAGQGLYSDTLHPSDVGHRKIAGIMARMLHGR